MSVTRLPSKKDVMEEVNQECRLCPEAVGRTVSTMLDMSLLRSPSFLLLAVSGFITMMGFYVPFMYVTGECRIHGSNKPAVGPTFTLHLLLLLLLLRGLSPRANYTDRAAAAGRRS